MLFNSVADTEQDRLHVLSGCLYCFAYTKESHMAYRQQRQKRKTQKNGDFASVRIMKRSRETYKTPAVCKHCTILSPVRGGAASSVQPKSVFH